MAEATASGSRIAGTRVSVQYPVSLPPTSPAWNVLAMPVIILANVERHTHQATAVATIGGLFASWLGPATGEGQAAAVGRVAFAAVVPICGRYGPFRLILTPMPCVDNFPIPSMTPAALVASVIRPPTRLFSWPVGLWAVYFLLANPSQ